MEDLIRILHDEGLTLVIKSEDGRSHRFNHRGVKDLLELVTHHSDVLKNAMIADKAVGKAAAACMVVGGALHVHADVMSEPALAMLTRHGVMSQYGQLVDHIINRSGDDWCPMERLSHDIDNPRDIILKISDFFKSIN